jgi:hypothetical protein
MLDVRCVGVGLEYEYRVPPWRDLGDVSASSIESCSLKLEAYFAYSLFSAQWKYPCTHRRTGRVLAGNMDNQKN